MSRVLASMVAVLVLSPCVRAEDTAKDILEKAIKAHGGAELLAKNKAGLLKAKGKLNVPGVGETDFTQEAAFMLPDKFKEAIELSIAGQNIAITSIANGDDFSVVVMGNKVEITDDIKAAFKASRHMMTVARLVPAREKGFELSLVGESKIEGAAVVTIRVSKKGEKDINLSFDKKTNLLAKVEYRTTDPSTQKEVNEERFFSDYKKDADGNMIPGKVVVKHDGEMHVTAEVTEGKYLEKLDESEFKK